MHALISFIVTAEPMTNPADVWYSPGVIGFIATFGVAGAAIALIFDMTRRVRRVRYRSEIQEKLEAEQSAAKAPSSTKPESSKPTASKPEVAQPAARRSAPAARPKPERPAAPAKPKRD